MATYFITVIYGVVCELNQILCLKKKSPTVVRTAGLAFIELIKYHNLNLIPK